MYTRGTLYGLFTPVIISLAIVTSDRIWLHILIGFGFTDHLQMCFLDYICSGCIGSAALDELVSALLLCASI